MLHGNTSSRQWTQEKRSYYPFPSIRSVYRIISTAVLEKKSTFKNISATFCQTRGVLSTFLLFHAVVSCGLFYELRLKDSQRKHSLAEGDGNFKYLNKITRSEGESLSITKSEVPFAFMSFVKRRKCFHMWVLDKHLNSASFSPLTPCFLYDGCHTEGHQFFKIRIIPYHASFIYIRSLYSKQGDRSYYFSWNDTTGLNYKWLLLLRNLK